MVVGCAVMMLSYGSTIVLVVSVVSREGTIPFLDPGLEVCTRTTSTYVNREYLIIS